MVFAKIQTIQINKTQTLAYSKNLYSSKKINLELYHSVKQDGIFPEFLLNLTNRNLKRLQRDFSLKGWEILPCSF